MNIIRAEHAPEFRGEDVVLLAMDGPGVTTFLTGLRDAGQRGASQLEHDGRSAPLCAITVPRNHPLSSKRGCAPEIRTAPQSPSAAKASPSTARMSMFPRSSSPEASV
jgi:hypothetical protein